MEAVNRLYRIWHGISYQRWHIPADTPLTLSSTGAKRTKSSTNVGSRAHGLIEAMSACVCVYVCVCVCACACMCTYMRRRTQWQCAPPREWLPRQWRVLKKREKEFCEEKNLDMFRSQCERFSRNSLVRAPTLQPGVHGERLDQATRAAHAHGQLPPPR